MFRCFIFQSTSQPSDMAKKVDQHLKLDEILDICADFEKQIKAEQEELKQIAQQKIEEEKNQINHQKFQHSQATKHNNQDYASIQFGAISFFPSTPPLPAKKGASPLKSPTNGISSHQWSPLNTLSPNRYVLKLGYVSSKRLVKVRKSQKLFIFLGFNSSKNCTL